MHEPPCGSEERSRVFRREPENSPEARLKADRENKKKDLRERAGLFNLEIIREDDALGTPTIELVKKLLT
ncbi:hypothetical protein L0Y46_03750 [bacterium]|nr:hypothetical protein [bacterium]